MILEAYRNPHKGDYDRYEDPFYVHGPILLLLVSLVADRAITVVFWSLESNPVVSTVGPVGWIVITLVAFLGVCFVWYPGLWFEKRVLRVWVYALSLFHLVAFGSNLLVVLGYL